MKNDDRRWNPRLILLLRISIFVLALLWLGSYNPIGKYYWKLWLLNQSSAALRASTPLLPVYPGRFYSKDELTEIVHRFEYDPTLSITVTYQSRLEDGYYSSYWLRTSRYNYTFDPRFGYITSRIRRSDPDFLRLNHSSDRLQGQPRKRISAEDAAAITLNFVQAHEPLPGDHKWRPLWKPHLGKPAMGGVGSPYLVYNTFLRPYTSDGVCGYGLCNIEIDAATGEVSWYTTLYVPIRISTIPTITSQDAMVAAMKAILIGDGKPGLVRGLSVAEPGGRQILVYDLNFTGAGIGGSGTHVARVDAHTGVVLTWYPQDCYDYICDEGYLRNLHDWKG